MNLWISIPVSFLYDFAHSCQVSHELVDFNLNAIKMEIEEMSQVSHELVDFNQYLLDPSALHKVKFLMNLWISII